MRQPWLVNPKAQLRNIHKYALASRLHAPRHTVRLTRPSRKLADVTRALSRRWHGRLLPASEWWPSQSFFILILQSRSAEKIDRASCELSAGCPLVPTEKAGRFCLIEHSRSLPTLRCPFRGADSTANPSDLGACAVYRRYPATRIRPVLMTAAARTRQPNRRLASQRSALR
jgi:hypothetical protein